MRLEYDVQTKDRYGRILAYVYVGDTFVNAELAKQGWANAWTRPPNVKHAELFVKLQREAMLARRGLWALPDVPSKKQEGPRGDADKPPAPSALYVAASKSKVFHRASCRHVGRITRDRRVYFKSREEGAKGRQPCKVCGP